MRPFEHAETYVLPKLDFESWRSWKNAMVHLFALEACSRIIDGRRPDPALSTQSTTDDTKSKQDEQQIAKNRAVSENWSDEDERAKMLIISCLDDHWIRFDVKQLETSSRMWIYLVEFFEGKGIERKRRCWYAFQDLKFEPGKKGMDFATEYRTALNAALEAGCQIDDESQVFDFIHRVGKQAPHFKLNQEMMIDAGNKVPELQAVLEAFIQFSLQHDRDIASGSSS